MLVDLEVLAVLLGQLATLGGLLDRQADPPAGEVEIDDLHPQLLAGRDDLIGRVDVVRRHLRDVHEALDAVADLDEGTELDELGDPAVDQLADLVGGGELLPRVLLGRLQRQADALAAHVDVEDLDVDLVADGDDRARVIDVLPGQLADVDEAVHAAEVDEGAEADDGRHRAVTDLADLEVVEELVARLLLRLLEVGAAAEHDVVAVLVELDDLGADALADVRLQVAHPAQLDEGGREEAAQPDVDDQAALDDLDHRTLDDAVLLLELLDRAPRPLVLRPLLRQQQAPLLVLLLQDEGLDLLTERDDLVRVDVVADAQLTRRDDALALVADVEQHLVLVDLDDRAVDELTVLDLDHRAVDGVGEGHAEVVGDDLARCVVALLVEGAEPGGRRHGGGGGGSGGVGQGTGCFRGTGGFTTSCR